jgi:hypothetical protein
MISVPLGTAEMPHTAPELLSGYGTLTYSEGDPPRGAPASDRSRNSGQNSLSAIGEPTVQQLATIEIWGMADHLLELAAKLPREAGLP